MRSHACLRHSASIGGVPAQAKAARYADTVALFAALGGGWWNQQDPAPEKPLTIGDFFQ